MARTRTDTHDIKVDAPAPAIFTRLSDVSRWPTLFPPTIHAEVLDASGGEERIRLWATAHGEAHSWTSRRALDSAGLRIDFRQERSVHPIRHMRGEWTIKPLDDRSSLLSLVHEYSAIDDTDEQLSWIARAVDGNSRAELEALKSALERESRDGLDAPFTFQDSLTTVGDPAKVFEFLDRADAWEQRLDHVAAAVMTEFDDGLQRLKMDTLAPDGSTHTTESFRVSFKPDRIVYKQTTLPALMSLHTGVWTIRPHEQGWQISSEHTVAIRSERVSAVLGPDATVQTARELARSNLGNNSRLTLAKAVSYAEGA
ncbi:MAG TPA: SRPBCC family protein [Jatrophihabitans sp.]|jgi:aromatase|uniref:aromatase/cyclase n=1 Tax=Jatrophihabitans sp. TaxID=1932789 RepID=UPI002EF0B410